MSDLQGYYELLEQKKQSRIESGFNVSEDELSAHLFPFQKYCVKRALAVGRFAMFEDCGLGKTIQQLEWAQRVAEHINRPIIILAPLAVVGQTIQEGVKFGYVVTEINDNTETDGCVNTANLIRLILLRYLILRLGILIKYFQGKSTSENQPIRTFLKNSSNIL